MPPKQVGQIRSEVLDAVDEARGYEPRTRLVERLLVDWLERRPKGFPAITENKPGQPLPASLVEPPVVEGGGQVGDPPPSGAERASNSDKGIVPPETDGECPYTAQQLSGMTRLPLAVCAARIKQGTWRELL